MTFFLIAGLVYFGMHTLVWGRICAQLKPGRRTRRLGWLIAAFLTITPFLAHFIPATWPQSPVRVAWWLVYLWMGTIFYLFWLQLAGLGVDLTARLLRPGWRARLPCGGRQLRLIVLITALTVGYGLYAATQWTVPRLAIESPHILRDTRVVLVSDTHFGVMTRQAWVDRLVAFIRDLDPDLVLFAGDQVNDHPEWLAPKARAVAGLNPPLGKFGVLGNHEFYVGLEISRDFHELAGIRLLRNESLVLPETGIQLLGIDDPAWGFRDRGFNVQQLARLAPEIRPDHFTLVVAHRPWGWEEKTVPLGIDLQVSGHTHGGQLFPFNWLVRLHYKHVAGHFEQAGRHLFVSTGALGWGPPLRVGARPEIVVIELLRQEPWHPPAASSASGAATGIGRLDQLPEPGRGALPGRGLVHHEGDDDVLFDTDLQHDLFIPDLEDAFAPSLGGQPGGLAIEVGPDVGGRTDFAHVHGLLAALPICAKHRSALQHMQTTVEASRVT